MSAPTRTDAVSELNPIDSMIELSATATPTPSAKSRAGSTTTCARWTAAEMRRAEQQLRRIFGYGELAQFVARSHYDISPKSLRTLRNLT